MFQQRAISQETLKLSVLEVSLKFINLKFQLHCPGTNEIILLHYQCVTCPLLLRAHFNFYKCLSHVHKIHKLTACTKVRHILFTFILATNNFKYVFVDQMVLLNMAYKILPDMTTFWCDDSDVITICLTNITCLSLCHCIGTESLSKPMITRTTRTPAFCDTPRRPMITHTSDSHQIPSQNNTKSKLQI